MALLPVKGLITSYLKHFRIEVFQIKHCLLSPESFTCTTNLAAHLTGLYSQLNLRHTGLRQHKLFMMHKDVEEMEALCHSAVRD